MNARVVDFTLALSALLTRNANPKLRWTLVDDRGLSRALSGQFSAAENSRKICAWAASGLRKLTGFAGAFILTMQNWSDNTLSRLPGYRDRICAVPLSANEGGLNLNMPSEIIKALTDRGSAAGMELLSRFSIPPTNPEMNWDNHRWIRLRSSLASIETMFTEIDCACEQPQPGDVDFESWAVATPPQKAPSYPWKLSQQSAALSMIKGVRKIVAECKQVEANVADGSPRPRGELRRRAYV